MRQHAITRAGRPKLRPIIAPIGLVIVWGLSMPVIKLGLHDSPPLTLVAQRYLAAAPCFLPVLIRHAVPAPRDQTVMAALGAFGVGLRQVSQAFGVRLTSASVATVISATIPIFTVIFPSSRLGQPVRPRHAPGLVSALAGISLVAMPVWSSGLTFGTVPLIGDALVLMSSLCIAGYYVFGTEVTSRADVPMIAALTSSFGAAVLRAPMGWELTEAAKRDRRGRSALSRRAEHGTAPGVLVWFHAFRALPIRVASASHYLQPLIGVVASAAWFDDPIGTWFAGGTLLVLGGVALTVYGGQR